MRECWNRQTGTFEVRVFRRVGSSPISRTSRKSLESNGSKLFSFYRFYNRSKGAGLQPGSHLTALGPNSLIKAALIKALRMFSIMVVAHSLKFAAGFRLRRFFAIFPCIWPQSAISEPPHPAAVWLRTLPPGQFSGKLRGTLCFFGAHKHLAIAGVMLGQHTCILKL